MGNYIEKFVDLLDSIPDDDVQGVIQDLRPVLGNRSIWSHNPVDYVKWVPIEKVQANDYNPNAVAKQEMKLLLVSIQADGYTQPVVTVYDEDKDMYVIVDGFHRYLTLKSNAELLEKNHGCVPVVVIESSIADRMASTIRHNRARGKHSVDGMSNIVYGMLKEGKSDSEICNELGLEIDELVRLKHITGYSKLHKDGKFNKAWETENQVKLGIEYRKSDGAENSYRDFKKQNRVDGSDSEIQFVQK